MNARRRERSMISADGSHRSSPAPVSSIGSIRGLYPTGRAVEVAVDRADDRGGKVGGGGEGAVVYAVRCVVMRVVVGGADPIPRTDDRDRAVASDAHRKCIGVEWDAHGKGGVGAGGGLRAELDQALVHRVGDDGA